jgi:hypothetical protein
MRLAHRALIAALVSLVLCAAVSAQTLRSPNDPRNQSPAVGTGGPRRWSNRSFYYLRRLNAASRGVHVQYCLQQLRS